MSLLARNAIRALVPVAFAALVGCGAPAREPMPPGHPNPRRNLAAYDAFAARVLRDGLEASWYQDFGLGTPARPARIGLRPILGLRDIEVEGLGRRLTDSEDLATLRAVHDTAVHVQAAKAREVEGLLDGIYRLRIERLGGQEVVTSETLVENLDPGARREAWMARAVVSPDLAPRMRRLAHARNRWALERSGLPFLDLMGRHRGYEPGTARRLRDQVARALALDDREREDLQDPWSPEGGDPELARRMAVHLGEAGAEARAAGFLDLAGVPPDPDRLTVAARPAAGRFWPYITYPIDPPRDVRILITPRAGIYGHWSMLHEFGHAAQALLAPEGGPAMLRRPVPPVAEGCAKVAERLAYAPEWLRMQGVPAEDVDGMAAWERASERHRMRRILADIEFEEAFYDDPESNLDTIYARILARIAGIHVPPDYPVWALNRSLTFEPLERTDYLVARCAQAAIYRRLRSLPGGLLGEEARRVLRDEVLAAAAGARFEDWFESAAGHPPDCDAWIEDVAGLPAGN